MMKKNFDLGKRSAVVLAVAGLASWAAWAAPMNARVIQPAYAENTPAAYESFEWLLAELDRCDPKLDLIVLPEFSDVPGRVPYGEPFHKFAADTNRRLLDRCAETAARCKAVVFVNALDYTAKGPRNTTWAFDRSGKNVGRYYKRHVTAGERDKCGLDTSYTREWTEPYTVVIDGVKYAFLTCYDFYFYDSYDALAKVRPDVVIGCSLQRSDRLDALEFINQFCAYNTAAYLVRASVSMGLDSPVGGSSMVVAPTGRILGNLKSLVGTLDVTFDPAVKYLKPAGFGNPPSTHPAYCEIGRRPWQYRPAGPALCPPLAEMPAKRLCAHRGFSAVAPENSLPAYGAAVALGASEIEFDLWWTKDGRIVSCHDGTIDRVSDGSGKITEKTYAELLKCDFGEKEGGQHFKGLRILRLEEILARFSCQTIFNIHVKMHPGDERLKEMVELIRRYDAERHCYFMTENEDLQRSLHGIAPDIPRCMGWCPKWSFARHVDKAVELGCWGLQLFKPNFDEETVKYAHEKGLRVNCFWSDDPDEARKFLDWGIDTILTNDYQPVSSALGLK